MTPNPKKRDGRKRSRVSLEIEEGLREFADILKANRCSNCGKRFTQPSCGISHAVLAFLKTKELSRQRKPKGGWR